jgi:hypothetical protein
VSPAGVCSTGWHAAAHTRGLLQGCAVSIGLTLRFCSSVKKFMADLASGTEDMAAAGGDCCRSCWGAAAAGTNECL